MTSHLPAHPTTARRRTVLDGSKVHAPNQRWKQTAVKATTTALAGTATASIAIGVASPAHSSISTGLAYASGPLAAILTWLITELHSERRNLVYNDRPQ